MGSLGERDMSGFRCSRFKYPCTESRCHYNELPDWEDLAGPTAGVFPRGIYPTDVDGMVEVSGHVLFLEEKKLMRPWDRLPEGQRQAFLSLSSRPAVTTAYFRPQYESTSNWELLVFEHGAGSAWQPTSREGLRDWIRDWCERADRNPYRRLDVAS